MKISHLVVNGCSFTFCQGLKHPEKEGWPTLLANKLGVPVVNLAARGSGNDGIMRRSTKYFFKNLPYNNNPFYITAWSMALRREEFVEYNRDTYFDDYLSLVVGGDLDIEQFHVRNLSFKGKVELEYKKLMYWATLSNLFENNNVNYFMTDYFPTGDYDISQSIQENYKELYVYVRKNTNRMVDFSYLTEEFEKLPCNHDGYEAQHVIAEYVYNQMLHKFGEIEVVKQEYESIKNHFPEPKNYLGINPWYYV